MIILTFNILNCKSNFKGNYQLKEEEIQLITEKNTLAILRTLEHHQILATFFLEISLVSKFQNVVKKIVEKGHEISFYNENSSWTEIETAKNEVELLIEKRIQGIRQKELAIPVGDLKNLEFSYISNIENADILFPLKRLKRGTEVQMENGMSLIPESISPYSQVPYNDFVFQMLPTQLYKNMVLETIKKEDFVMIYLDSWQFTDFEKYLFAIPFYRKYNSGKKMDDKLESFLTWMNEEELAFSRMKDFIF